MARSPTTPTVLLMRCVSYAGWGSPDYVKSLRSALDDAGFDATRIILPDGSDCSGPVAAAESDPAFAAAIHGIGLHYPCQRTCPGAIALGKVYWASEDYSTVADWSGGGCWGRSLIENYGAHARPGRAADDALSPVYHCPHDFCVSSLPFPPIAVRLNATATIAWSLIWAVYTPGLPFEQNGLMYSYTPWSGSYSVMSPIWTSAHVTQFAQPGWTFLSVAGNGSGLLPGGGAYVTLVPPVGSDVTLIVESLAGDCLRCQVPHPVDQNVTFVFPAAIAPPGTVLHVWMTNATSWFTQQADISVGAGGDITVFVPADTMWTFSTLSTAAHGAHPPPPDATAFPFPYSDAFDTGNAYDSLPRFFADQGGSFAVRNGSVHQVAVANPGPNGWVGNNDPFSLVGDATWADYTATVTTTFADAQAGLALGAATSTPTAGSGTVLLQPCDASSPYQRWAQNSPASGYLSNTVNGLQQCLNVDGCQSDVILWQCVTTGGTCCGATCYNNLQWSVSGAGTSGPVTTPLNGECLTADATAGTLTTAPCSASSAAQTWLYNATTQQLQLQGGECLSSPPARVYTQLCVRVANDNVFDVAPIPGYCVSVDDKGSVQLAAGGSVLATAAIGPAFDPTAPHTLSITAAGSTIKATVDATPVGPVVDATFPVGMVAIGSGYHFATFDSFSVQA